MKFLMFAVVVGLACVVPGRAQASFFGATPTSSVPTCCPCHVSVQPSVSCISGESLVTGVIAGVCVAGFIGLIYYCCKQQPFWNLSSAKSSYNHIDQELLTLFDRYATGLYDLAQLSSSLYIDSPYALVKVSERLKFAQNVMLQARSSVQAALNSYVKEESFIAECHQLKRKINKRIDLINEYISFVHMHPLWSQQYALYVQDCNYREMIRLQEKHNRDLYRLQGRVEELSRQTNNSVGNVVIIR